MAAPTKGGWGRGSGVLVAPSLRPNLRALVGSMAAAGRRPPRPLGVAPSSTLAGAALPSRKDISAAAVSLYWQLKSQQEQEESQKEKPPAFDMDEVRRRAKLVSEGGVIETAAVPPSKAAGDVPKVGHGGSSSSSSSSTLAFSKCKPGSKPKKVSDNLQAFLDAAVTAAPSKSSNATDVADKARMHMADPRKGTNSSSLRSSIHNNGSSQEPAVEPINEKSAHIQNIVNETLRLAKSQVDASIQAAKAAAAAPKPTRTVKPSAVAKMATPHVSRPSPPREISTVPTSVETQAHHEDRDLEPSDGALDDRRYMERRERRCGASRRRPRSRGRRHNHSRRRKRKRSRSYPLIYSCSCSRSRLSSRSRSRRRGSLFTDKPAPAETSLASQAGRPGQEKELPEWLQDLAAPKPGQVGAKRILRLSSVQIRCLLGRGGGTIQAIINRTGAAIQINGSPQDFEGDATLAGKNLDEAERMVRDVLLSKGCPLPTATGPKFPDDTPGIVRVPTELVGALIGPKGTHLNEIKAKIGGACIIQVLPQQMPDGCQLVQVAGDTWVQAKELVVAKLNELRLSMPGRWNSPGFCAAEAANATPVGPRMPFPQRIPKDFSGVLPAGLLGAAAHQQAALGDQPRSKTGAGL